MAVKKEKNITGNVLAISIIIVVAIISGWVGVYSLQPEKTTPLPNIDKPVEPTTVEYKTSLVMVGDALIHSLHHHLKSQLE